MRNNVPDLSKMKSIKDMEALSDIEKEIMLKAAKPGAWYDGWKPYCMTCEMLHRMEPQSYGFKCPTCNNMIGFDLRRLQESPLNHPDK